MRKFYSGTSLFEVLIVLIIISVTTISAMSLYVAANIKIREGEIKELANGVTIKVLELMRTPNLVKVQTTTPDGMPSITQTNYKYYKLVTSANNLSLSYVSGGTDLTSCSSTDQYYFTSSLVSEQSGKKFLVCMQVLVKGVNDITFGSDYYEILIRSVYGLEGAVSTDIYKTYRFYGFEQVL